jgi:membrane protein required for colicin V production
MTGFDIAVLIIVGAGAIQGFTRGFVQEIMALAGWFLALFAIRFLHAPFSLFLAPHVGSSSGGSVLALAILAIVPFALARMAARWAGAGTRGSFLGPIDRVIGFGFGAIKGIILTVIGFSLLVLAYDVVWGVGGRPSWMTLARSYELVNAASVELLEKVGDRRKAAVDGEKKSRSKNKRAARGND